jgi:hypothetical protein
LKYPVEDHPTAQYEKGFKCLHVEGLSCSNALLRNYACEFELHPETPVLAQLQNSHGW